MPELKLLVLKTVQPDVLCDFYIGLGFRFAEEQHGNGLLHFTAPLGDGILEIYPLPEGGEADSTTRLGFGVTEVASKLVSLPDTAEVVSEPKKTEWGVRAVVRDPDGRTVELYESP